jgi:hypothetical protein
MCTQSSDINVTHCEGVFVADSFSSGMGVQTLPQFFQKFHVSPSLFRSIWVFIIDVKSVVIINQYDISALT